MSFDWFMSYKSYYIVIVALTCFSAKSWVWIVCCCRLLKRIWSTVMCETRNVKYCPFIISCGSSRRPLGRKWVEVMTFCTLHCCSDILEWLKKKNCNSKTKQQVLYFQQDSGTDIQVNFDRDINKLPHLGTEPRKTIEKQGWCSIKEKRFWIIFRRCEPLQLRHSPTSPVEKKNN